VIDARLMDGNSLRICSWNVNGIKNPFGYKPWSEKKSYAGMFETLEADIVCMQEVKIQRKDITLDMVEIPGWNVFFSLPRARKGYSGVAIYTRDSKCMPYKAEEGLTGCLPSAMPDKSPYWTPASGNNIDGYLQYAPADALSIDSEGRCILLDFGLFILINVYCPAMTDEGRQPYRMAFLEAMEKRVRNLHALGRNIILVGDLNIVRDVIDTAEPSDSTSGNLDFKSSASRQLLDRMLLPHEDGILADVCRHLFPERTGMFTHWDTKINARPGNYGSRIDYILCSASLLPQIEAADIYPGLLGSDHCPVFATLRVPRDDKPIDSLQTADQVQNAKPPRLAARFMSAFAGRQTIGSMFASMTAGKKEPAVMRNSPQSSEPVHLLKEARVGKRRASSQPDSGNLLSFVKRSQGEKPKEEEAVGIDRDENLKSVDGNEFYRAISDENTTKVLWKSLFAKQQSPLCDKHKEP